MEVCLQCHLESASRTLPDAVRRFGRSTFSYRPSEPLAAWQLYFDFVRHGGRGPDHRQQLRLRLDAVEVLPEQRRPVDVHHLSRPSPRGIGRRHARPAGVAMHRRTPRPPPDCTGCHMPKRRTEDAVHVLMTDHFIRRQPGKDDAAPLAERHDRLDRTGPAALSVALVRHSRRPAVPRDRDRPQLGESSRRHIRSSKPRSPRSIRPLQSRTSNWAMRAARRATRKER